jgi:hypothetical protein
MQAHVGQERLRMDTIGKGADDTELKAKQEILRQAHDALRKAGVK